MDEGEKERNILSFEELLEREKYILCDSSVGYHSDFNWYYEEVYGTGSFSRINEAVLRRVVVYLEDFLLFLSNPNVYTVSWVSCEFENARNMVEKKMHFLHAGYGFRRKYKRPFQIPIQKELLEEIQTKFHEMYLQSRRSLLRPEKKKLYGSLENIVLGVTSNTNSKIDFDFLYGEYTGKEKEDFHTDEQLVATALYLSLAGKESCIFTRDSDIRRILINTLRYLSHPEAHNLGDMMEAVRENRVIIYYNAAPEQAEISLDTSQFKLIGKLPLDRVKAINQTLT